MSVMFKDIPNGSYFKLPDSNRIHMRDSIDSQCIIRALVLRTALTEQLAVITFKPEQIVIPVYGVMFTVFNSANESHSMVTDKFGNLHNEHGPAQILDTTTTRFYYHGVLHNLNGPSIIWNSGSQDYFILGDEYPTYLEYLVAVEQFKTKPNKKQEKMLQRIAKYAS